MEETKQEIQEIPQEIQTRNEYLNSLSPDELIKEMKKMEPEELVEFLTPQKIFSFGGSAIIIRILREIALEDYKPDVHTEKGRDAISSRSYKVARSKTFLDKVRVKLKEEYMEKIKPIDSEGKKIRDAMEALQEEIKKPLTEWEDEQARIKAEKEAKILKDLEDARLAKEAEEKAKLEAEKAELARKQAEFDRKQAEFKAQQDAINAENARKAKEEQDRIDAEKAKETARLKAEADAKAKAEFEENARKQAEAKAKADAEKAIKEANERAEKAKRDAEKAIADAKAKADKEAQDKADKEAKELKAKVDEEARLKAEHEKRQADIAHRGNIMGQTKEDLMKLGLDEELAKKVVKAIVAGGVRNVKLTF